MLLSDELGRLSILEHYQALLNDGSWHQVQLYIVGRQAVLILDNVTMSSTLHGPIRTGKPLCFLRVDFLATFGAKNSHFSDEKRTKSYFN